VALLPTSFKISTQHITLMITHRAFTPKLVCFDKVLGNKNICQEQLEEKLNASPGIMNPHSRKLKTRRDGTKKKCHLYGNNTANNQQKKLIWFYNIPKLKALN